MKPLCHVGVVAVAALVALAGARPFAGSWNDGSRLATVEALVDYDTWAIDDSVFLCVPDGHPRPYPPPYDTEIHATGTCDRLRIGDHWYSDKSPVPALWLAGVYGFLQMATGLTAQGDPVGFCRWMVLASSGLAYVVAVWSVFRLGEPLRLDRPTRLLLTASFGLATVAVPYLRHVNNHMQLLAVAAAVAVELTWLAECGATPGRLVRLGTLLGIGYTIDLGAGPVLLIATACLIAYRHPRPLGWLLCAAAGLPWIALHHWLNWRIGGTVGPANAVSEYLSWPGSPFSVETMTGGWKHDSVGDFALYGLDMLFGKKGFLGHNLALFVALPGAIWLAVSCPRWRPEALYCIATAAAVWLVYGVSSNNLSGACIAVRWFVPLLAPGYFALAMLVRERLAYRFDVALLSAWGAGLAVPMWDVGPWKYRMVPGYWLFVAGGLATWGVASIYTHVTGSRSAALAVTATPGQRAAIRSASDSTAKRSVA